MTDEQGGDAPDGSVADLVVEARPLRTGVIANVSALVVVVVFGIIALVMKTHSAGASFGWRDQVFTFVLGVIIALGIRLPARPRLRADRAGVRFRGYAGDWRELPWSAVRAIEFPTNVRFARLSLGGEESFALYAVQRMDREKAVATMRGLRALFEASRSS